MRIFTAFSLFLGSVFCTGLHGQEFKEHYYNHQINFYQVVKKAEAYYQTQAHEEGSGYKGYQRWKYSNEYKYFPSGDRSQIDPYFAQKQWEQFLEKQPRQKGQFTHAWQDLGPFTLGQITGHYSPGLGRVETFYVHAPDPNVIYLGSRSGGFWYTQDGGQSWSQSTTDFLPATGVNTMAVNPTNHQEIFANIRNADNGTTHGIYHSTNGGVTWQLSPFSPANLGWGGLGTNDQVNVIRYHPRVPNLIFIGTNQGFYTSTDNLQTYSRSLRFSNISQIAFHPTDNDILYVYNSSFGNNQIWISTDRGATFNPSPSLPVGTNGEIKIATAPPCDSCVWVAANNGVAVSYDLGNTFTGLSNPRGTCDGFTVNDQDTSNLLFGMLDLYASTDGGRNFSQVAWWALGNGITVNGGQYVHADLRMAQSVNGVLYAATDGYLAKSSDKGQTWQIISDGTGIRENYNLAVSQSNHYRTVTGSQDNGTSILREDGWLEFFGADGMEGLIHPLNDDYLMGSFQFGGRRVSYDGGITQEAGFRSSDGYWVAPLLLDPKNQLRIYNFDDHVHRSNDFGQTWQTLGQPFSDDINHAAIAQNNSRLLVCTQDQRIALSRDGGQTFNNIKGTLPNRFITDVVFAPHNDSILVVTYGHHTNDGNKVFITFNQGQSWQNITGNLGDMPIRTVVIDPRAPHHIYVGAEIGVYTKPLQSGSWSLFNTGLPNCTMNELEIMYGSNTLRGATWGRGTWEVPLLGRETYPKIMDVSLKNNPGLSQPRANKPQSVRAEITYTGTLNKVWVEYALGSSGNWQSLAMQNLGAQTWETLGDIPSGQTGDTVFFKVLALGNQADTSITYTYMYTQKSPGLCAAQGGNAGTYQNYINRIKLAGLDNTSGNDGYADYTNGSLVSLQHNTSYTLEAFTQNQHTDELLTAWIDFDDNSEFDTSEVIVSIPVTQPQVQANFTTPLFVGADTLTMRVRLGYRSNTYPNALEPCGNAPGEVEDYAIVLNGGTFSVVEPNQEYAVEVFPNPAKGLLNVVFPENEKAQFKLINSQGQLVFENYRPKGGAVRLNTQNWAPGLYWLSWQVNAQSGTRKIIIE